MHEFLKAVCRFLRILREGLKADEISPESVSPEALGITANEWARMVRMLVREGYIEGFAVMDIDGSQVPAVRAVSPAITLKGLEYLEENGVMKRAMETAKNIREVLPV